MVYTAYATGEDYYELLPDAVEISENDLIQASRHIDSLTYNRIVAAGFDNLTQFQKDIVKEVCCRHSAFEVENADVISAVISSYSINGVSMTFGSGWNVFIEHGVAMRRDVYSLLCQTGLCSRILR